jgi:hypothetical protein
MAAADHFYAYGCGLALLALAGLVYLLTGRCSAGRPAWWLIGFGLIQAMIEWSALLANPTGAAAANLVLFGVLQALSLVALAEYGRSVSLAAKPTDGRWIYVPLVGLLIAATAGQPGWFELGVTVLMAVQGSFLIAKFKIQSLAKQQSYPLQTTAALAAVGFLFASVFDADGWKLLSLLTILVALWVIDAQFQQAANKFTAKRQYGIPLGFCAILLGGALLLTSNDQQPNLSSLPHQAVAEVSDTEAAAADASSVWLQACCLALGPPIVLIAVAWGVSRLRRETVRVGI